MVQARYEIPLPNDGKGYRFTEKELVELMDRVYEKGRMDEKILQMNIIESVTMKSIDAGVWLVN